MATSAQIDALVALYAGYFNRAPDPAGLQFWIDQIDGGREFNTIAADFAASAEATALYPYLTTPDVASPSTFITSIYQNLFNRAPDAEGLQFWSDVLASGSVSVADMIEAIINGAVDAPDATPPTFDAATLQNKIEVGRDFAEDAANTTGFEFDTAAKSAAIAAIDGVTNDEATVVAAKAATDAYLAGEANKGETFTLTTGADVLVGTAGNDTFNALSVNATGDDATTFSAFDAIDGGAGTDTLNIYSDSNFDNEIRFDDKIRLHDEARVDLNDGFPTAATVKNVEIINIHNSDDSFSRGGDGFGDVDASMFEGATQVWQIGNANAIEGLAASTTAGFRDTASATALAVTAAAGAASATVALDDVADGNLADGNSVTLNVRGDDLASATVVGTVAAGTNDSATQELNLNVTAGDDVTALTVSSAIDSTTLTIVDADDDVDTIDASGSTGGIAFTGDVDVNTFTGGSGDDDITTTAVTVADDAATTADETEAAVVMTGEGDDTVTVNTSGDGTTTVDVGAGDDTVDLVSDGSGKLSVNLGEGDDSFMVTGGAVSKGDTIDGGAGTDTVQLKDIGSANIGAFTNFEVFDVKDLSGTLDVDILATNNTVTEFVGSDAVAADGATLTNLGAGVGFRATGNMGRDELELTQKTAGELTVTLDADSTADARNNTLMVVNSTNATSVNAVFDVDSAAEQTTLSNDQAIVLNANAATTVNVTSGGTNATNILRLNDDNGVAGTAGVLTSVTITGSQDISLVYTADVDGSALATVDASALTGGLTISLEELKNGATVSLGAGSDTVNLAVDAGAAAADVEALVGFEAAASNDADDVAEADIIDFENAATIVGDDDNGLGDVDIVDGVVTFLGAGPTTFAQAVSLVDNAVTVDNTAALFEYLGDSYVFVENGDGDSVVELTGVTGVTELGANADANLFIV